MNELHVALILNVLDLKVMQLLDEHCKQFLMSSLLFREVHVESSVEILHLLVEALPTFFRLFAHQNSLFRGLEYESDDQIHADAHDIRVSLCLGRLHQSQLEDVRTHQA